MAKKLYVNEDKHAEAIQERLDDAQKRAQINIVRFYELGSLAKAAEKSLLEAGVLKKDSPGAQYVYLAGGPDRAYKYKQGATLIVLRREQKGWILARVERVGVYPKQREMNDLILTDHQIQIAQERLVKRHSLSEQNSLLQDLMSA